MAGSRKILAVLRIALISAAFWGVAAVLIPVAFELLTGRLSTGLNEIPSLARTFFLEGAAVGFVGGALYAGFLAIVPVADGTKAVSAKRAALFGAIGGMILFLVIRVALIGGITTELMATAIGTTVFGALGAATALGLHGTASRGGLAMGDEAPEQITR